MAKNFKPGSILPTDAKFYPLPLLQDGFELTIETLNKNFFPLPKVKKGLKGVWAGYRGFERELISVAVTFPSENIRYLFIHVDPGEMQVYCDCGMPQGILCKHVYHGFRNLMYYRDSFNFKHLFWPGYGNESNGKNKFLDITAHDFFLRIKPKKSYGALFRPGIGFDDKEQLIFENLPEWLLSHQPQGQALTLGYFIVYKRQHMPEFHLPFLLPYLGITDKQGKKLLQFKAFITEMTPAEILYTSRQTELNKISHEMFALVNSIYAAPGMERSINTVLKTKLLGLWHKAFQLGLSAEPYLHTYQSGGLKALFKRPFYSLARECKLSDLSPALSFLLRDKGDHYSLLAVTFDHEYPLESTAPKIPFFITGTNNDVLYALATVQDADLLNWLDDHDNCLTVLKIHFIIFHEEFLKRLSECYTVMYMGYRAKHKVVYDYEAVVSGI
jgi:hypothetical protein